MHCWLECKMASARGKQLGVFLEIKNRINHMILQFHLGYVTKRTENSISNSYVHTMLSLLFNSEKAETTYFSLNRYIDKCGIYIKQNIIHQKKEVLIHAQTLMNLENFMLSEIRQTKKVKQCMNPLIQNRFLDTVEKRLPGAGGRGQWGGTA